MPPCDAYVKRERNETSRSSRPRSHSLHSPSSPPLTKKRPSAEAASARTALRCSRRCATSTPRGAQASPGAPEPYAAGTPSLAKRDPDPARPTRCAPPLTPPVDTAASVKTPGATDRVSKTPPAASRAARRSVSVTGESAAAFFPDTRSSPLAIAAENASVTVSDGLSCAPRALPSAARPAPLRLAGTARGTASFPSRVPKISGASSERRRLPAPECARARSAALAPDDVASRRGTRGACGGTSGGARAPNASAHASSSMRTLSVPRAPRREKSAAPDA